MLAKVHKVYWILTKILHFDLRSERRPLEDSEDKALAKLGVTYGVLRRLGFSEDRVEECLRSISGVDLDEAYEWVSFIPLSILVINADQ